MAELTAPKWFSEGDYLFNKLAQLQATDPAKGWTAEQLNAALKAADLTPYQHFLEYGANEHVSPNSSFNVSQYLAAKAAQLNAGLKDGEAAWTEASVSAAIKAAGLNEWSHYNLYGSNEGVNPSNAFDASDYLAAKTNALLAAGEKQPDGSAWTVEAVQSAIARAGMSVLEHYLMYAGQGQLEVPAGATYPVPAAEQVAPTAGFNPYNPGAAGSVFNLTTAVDTITGTEKDDTINGVASSLTKDGTLNTGDKIDGAGGVDTLSVKMDSSFAGFTGDGKMINVEHVVLTNDGTIARSFSAKGSEGVESFTLKGENGVINVTDIAEIAANGLTVNIEGLKAGAPTIGIAADAVKGDKDAMTLGLNNVGAIAENGTATVKPTVNGIENLSVSAIGDNHVDLSGVSNAKSVVANGAGSLDITHVAAGVTSFDASAMIGSLKADLSDATVKTVKGGNGDDVITVKNLAPNVTLEGGAGNDTLVLKGVTATLQPTMSGFETVRADTGVVTISGKNVKDFTALEIVNGATVTLANVEAPEFTVTAKGATGGSMMMTSATNLTYNTVASDTTIKDKASDTVTTTITASEATAATINAGAYTSTGGQIDLAKAASVTVNVASGLGGADGKTEMTRFSAIVNALKAESLLVNADGLLAASAFNVTSASSVTLNAASGGGATVNAAKATAASVTAGDSLALDGDLSRVEAATLTANKGILNASSINFSNINVLNVSGVAETSSVVVGDLGHAGQGYGITVNASGLKGGLVINAITTTEGDVALNLAEVTGAANVMGTVQGKNVTVHASQLGTTTLDDIDASGDVAIDAMGILGSMTINDITAGNTVDVKFDGASTVSIGDMTGKIVNLDASGYLQSLTTGAITATTANIKGSEIADNSFSSITADNLTYTGGLDTDSVALTGKSTAATKMALSVDTGAGTAVDSFSLITAATTAALKLTGTIANAGLVTIDGSATLQGMDMSGLAITGNTTATIKGGAGDDILKATKGLDTITLGGGIDKVIIGAGDSGITALTADKITGFSSNDDELALGFAGTAANVVINLTDANDFDTALTNANTALDGTVRAFFQVVGSNSFLFQDIDGDGTADQAIQLVGTTTFAVTDIVAA